MTPAPLSSSASASPHAPSELSLLVLLCVEWVLEPDALSDASLREAHLKEWAKQLDSLARDTGGTLERVHQSMAFILFAKDRTVADCLHSSLRFIRLCWQDAKLAGLPLRFGLSLDNLKKRSPMAGSTERLLARPNRVVIHQGVLQWVGETLYPFAPVLHSDHASSTPLTTEDGHPLFYELQREAWLSELPAPSQGVSPFATSTKSMVNDDGFGDLYVAGFEGSTQPSATVWQEFSLPTASQNTPASPTQAPPTHAHVFSPKSNTLVESIQAQHSKRSESPAPRLPDPPEALLKAPVNASMDASVLLHSPVSAVPEDHATEPLFFAEPTPILAEESTLLPSLGLPLFNAPVFPPSWVGCRWIEGRQPPTVAQHVTWRTLLEELTEQLHPQRSHTRLLYLQAPTGTGKTTMLQLARLQIEQQLNPHATDEQAEPGLLWLQTGSYRSHLGGRLPALPFPLEAICDLLRGLFNLPTEGLPAHHAWQYVYDILAYVAPDNWAWQAQQLMVLEPLLCLKRPEELATELKRALQQPLLTATQAGLVPTLFTLLETLQQHKPLVLQLDNVEQMDEASLWCWQQLCKHGLLNLPNVKMVISSSQGQPSGWLQSWLNTPHARVLVLPLMQRDELLNYLEHGPLQGGGLSSFPPEQLNHLLQLAEGSPLAIEEALRWLMSHHALRVDETTGGLQWNEKQSAKLVWPDSLEDLLFSRLEALPEPEQQALRFASLLAPRFAPNTLQALMQEEDEATFNARMSTLWEQGWLTPDVAGGLMFRHPALVDVCASTIAPEEQQQLFAWIYTSLHEGFGTDVAMNPCLLACYAVQGKYLAEALNHVHQWWQQLLPILGVELQLSVGVVVWQLTLHQERSTALSHSLLEQLVALARHAQQHDPQQEATHYEQFAKQGLRYLAYQTLQQQQFSISDETRFAWLVQLADDAEQELHIGQALQFRQWALNSINATDFKTEQAMVGVHVLESLRLLGQFDEAAEQEARLDASFATLSPSVLVHQPTLLLYHLQFQLCAASTALEQANWQALEKRQHQLNHLLQSVAQREASLPKGSATLLVGRHLWQYRTNVLTVRRRLWQGQLPEAQQALEQLAQVLETHWLAALKAERLQNVERTLLWEVLLDWAIAVCELAWHGGGKLPVTLMQACDAILAPLRFLAGNVKRVTQVLPLLAVLHPQLFHESHTAEGRNEDQRVEATQPMLNPPLTRSLQHLWNDVLHSHGWWGLPYAPYCIALQPDLFKQFGQRLLSHQQGVAWHVIAHARWLHATPQELTQAQAPIQQALTWCQQGGVRGLQLFWQVHPLRVYSVLLGDAKWNATQRQQLQFKLKQGQQSLAHHAQRLGYTLLLPALQQAYQTPYVLND
ncbi:MAG: hypothetical protein ACKO34_03185 [Vampirovibrionales bacterium]